MKRRAHPLDAIRLSPYRPVRWRYNRVMELIESPVRGRRLPVRNVDDRWITKAFDFIRKWEAYGELDDEGEAEYRRRGLIGYNMPLYQAYEVFMRPDGDRYKSALEGRILVGQDDETIAPKIGVSARTVKWYERMFFNVRDRLENVDYIMSNVIGPLIGAGFENATAELSAKFLGYLYRSERILEFVLRGTDVTLAAPNGHQSVIPFMDSVVENNVRALAARTVQGMQANRFNAPQILELHTQLMAAHREAQGADMSRTNIEDNVAAFLGGISWVTGTSRKELLSENPLGGYLGHTVEPRAADQLAIVGGQVPEHLADIADRQLPPPRKKDKVHDFDGVSADKRTND